MQRDVDPRLVNSTPADPESFALVAADGYELAATRFAARGSTRGQIVVAGATGVRQRFYRRFAQFAAARGYATLTLDYRGIGDSRPKDLRGFRMDYRDWARLDVAAAVEHAVSRQQGQAPLFLTGHSYGGHVLGLLPSPEHVSGMYAFGTGAGWHGWMPRLERLRVLAMWKLIGPLLTRWKGYLPWQMLGMGEDLPLDVYRQWREWCRHPRYFFDVPELAADITASFERIRVPIVAANSLDDLWAPPASRDAFMAGYRGSDWQGLDIDPATAGIGPIGHMGYFRLQAETLWRDAIDWFDELAVR